jgi:hypothetical protein
MNRLLKYSVSLLSALAMAATLATIPLHAQLSPNATVFASGLQGPRGLKFGPDGKLYVAEAGTGGLTSTAGTCAQVVPPIGPYTNGNTSRISRIDRGGERSTVATGFPSAQGATGDVQGVADVAFLDGKLYAVLAGAGCSHGSALVPNSIVHVDTSTGTWKIVADLSDFIQIHPAMYVDSADFEPDGVFYSLIADNDLLYTVEPNHGQVFSVSPQGAIHQAVDVSEAEGHIVPTSIAEKDGKFYVGNLGLFPITPQSSKILTLSHEACRWPFVAGLGCSDDLKKLKVAGSRAGFTTVVAVDYGPDGLLYALELSPASGFPTPGLGNVVRLNRSGAIEVVAYGLSVPTGMTFGPDGALYVSNFGAAPAGAGQILRITVP